MSKVVPRPKRSTFELQAVSAHLLYEIEMLADLVEAMGAVDTGFTTTGSEWAVRNALLESFTIHARSLVGFFYPRRPQPDDAIAEDFFDDDTWSRRGAPENPSWSRVRRRVGKEIAHLTYQRHNPYEDAATWPHGKIFLELAAVVGDFVRLVPQERLHPDFTQRVTEALPGIFRWASTGGLANAAAATAAHRPPG